MTTFVLNANDPYVRLIQRALNEQLQLNLKRDGNLGPATQAAIRQWQVKNGMPAGTGAYQGPTADALDVYISNRFLNNTDYQRVAAGLSAEVASVKAVTLVESDGEGFLPSGKTTILFERHVFRRQLDLKLIASPSFTQQLISQLNIPAPLAGSPEMNPVTRVQMHLASLYNDIYNAVSGGYAAAGAPGGEWARLQRAAAIDLASAQESASWGLFQIMGYYWSRLGFGSAQAMVDAMNASEHNQISAFSKFVATDHNLLSAIQTKNWTNFAKFYNGQNYAANQYDTKLATAYKASL